MEIANDGYKSNDDEDRTTSDTDPTLKQHSIQSSEQSSVQSPKQSSEEVAEQSPQQSHEQSIEPTSSSTQEADRDSLTCSVCSSRTFGTRQELLHHLSLTHFNMLLLEKYPLKVNINEYFDYDNTIILILRMGITARLKTAMFSSATRSFICSMWESITKKFSLSLRLEIIQPPRRINFIQINLVQSYPVKMRMSRVQK